jgi:hypothetical protein
MYDELQAHPGDTLRFTPRASSRPRAVDRRLQGHGTDGAAWIMPLTRRRPCSTVMARSAVMISNRGDEPSGAALTDEVIATSTRR